MKSENSKLLLGLGLGAIVGVAVGYLMTGENRRKLEDDLHEVGHGIKDGVKSAFSKVKSKAEQAEAKFAGKAEEWSDKAGKKAEQWADEAGNRASGIADNMKHDTYARNFQQDVNDMKDKSKTQK